MQFTRAELEAALPVVHAVMPPTPQYAWPLLAARTGIDLVVNTHLHFDHAGGVALLPDSVPVVIQRREWEGGQDPEAIARNFFQPKDYEAIGDRVELVPRRLHEGGDVIQYFWKVKPCR